MMNLVQLGRKLIGRFSINHKLKTSHGFFHSFFFFLVCWVVPLTLARNLSFSCFFLP